MDPHWSSSLQWWGVGGGGGNGGDNPAPHSFLIQPFIQQLICQIALATSSSPSSPSSPPTTTLLISLKLLRACVGSSHQLLCPPLSLAVVIFQRHLHHFSSEVLRKRVACTLLSSSIPMLSCFTPPCSSLSPSLPLPLPLSLPHPLSLSPSPC